MTAAIVLPPYALGLGCVIERMEGEVPVIACDYGLRTAGRPGFWRACGFVVAVDDDRFPVMRRELD